MNSQSHMPWGMLRSETVKAIFQDLGLNDRVGRRDDMLEWLQQVEKDGLDAVAEKLSDLENRDSASSGRASPRPMTYSRVGRLPKSRRWDRTGLNSSVSARKQSQEVKQVFEGVVLPAPKAHPKKIFIGVFVPSISQVKSSSRTSIKRKVEQEDATEQSGNAETPRKGKRRMSQTSDSGDDPS